MLTVREVEAAVAEMLNVPPPAAAHYIRTLKEAEPPLWFRVGRGRTEASISPSHLVNVVLAFVGGPPVEAPASVALLRGMQLKSIRSPIGQELYGEGMRDPVVVGGFTIYPTLGETLDAVSDVGDDRNHLRPRVDIEPKGSMVGVIEARVKVTEGLGDYCVSFASVDERAVDDMGHRQFGSASMISRTITLQPHLFQRMVELLNCRSRWPGRRAA